MIKRFWKAAIHGFRTTFGTRQLRAVIDDIHSLRFAKAPAKLVEDTRMQWAHDARVHIDDDPAMRIARDGAWVQAWLLAGQVAYVSPEARLRALAGLPLMMREVYSLHRESSLGFAEIGVRLGLGRDEAERYFAHALILMDRLLEAD